jgi:hypothetical protein
MPLVVFGATLSLLWPTACARRGPEPQRYPSGSQLVANSQGVGVPYGRWVLVRDSSRLVALKITARSPRGEHISYEWSATALDSEGFRSRSADHGKGTASEEPFTGHISLPGMRLEWSRGSSKMGWLYWPERGGEISVFSRAWNDIDDIDPASLQGRWLKNTNKQPS